MGPDNEIRRLSRRLRGASALAVGLALLVGCGGGDDESAASATDTAESEDETTTTRGETTTTGDETTTTSDDAASAPDCPLTSEEVSGIVGSTVEEQVDLRTGADCQYTGGGQHVVLGVRAAGASPDEYIQGNEEFFGPAEELEGVGDQAAVFEDGSLLAFVDGQVISVLGAPTPDAATALALAVIAGM